MRSVSLLTSAYDQSAITGGCHSRMRGFLSIMQQIDGYLVTLKDFDYSCSSGYISGQLRQKVNDAI